MFSIMILLIHMKIVILGTCKKVKQSTQLPRLAKILRIWTNYSTNNSVGNNNGSDQTADLAVTLLISYFS